MIDIFVKKNFIAVIIILIAIFGAGIFLFSRKNSTPAGEGKKERIGIGIVTADEKAIKKYQAFVDYLNKNSDDVWYLEPIRDYGSFISQLELHQIESGFMGSAVAYRTFKEGIAFPVVRGEKDGVSTYYSYIFVKKNNGIDNIEGLKNKRFAYVDINTSAGYLYPVYLLKSNGYDPDNFFRAATFAGSHEKAISLVLDGDYDGGSAKDIVWKKISLENPSLEKNLSIIEKEGPFPEDTFMVSADLGVEEIRELRGILLKLQDSDEGKELLEKLNLDRFIATNEEDFAAVKKISE